MILSFMKSNTNVGAATPFLEDMKHKLAALWQIIQESVLLSLAVNSICPNMN